MDEWWFLCAAHRWAMLCDLSWRPAVETLSESEECQSYFPKQGDLNQSA